MEFLGALVERDDAVYFDDSSFVRDWVLQMEKDLTVSFDVPSPTKADIQEVLDKLQAHLKTRFAHSESALPQLLYRIDISEKVLQREMKSSRWNSWHELLAHQIAAREATKVIFRRKFSSGKI